MTFYSNQVGQAAQALFESMLMDMNGNYDPELIGKQFNVWIDPESLPPKFQKKLRVSIKRYFHYVNSDLIKQKEITPFKREWIVNAYSLISQDLLQLENTLRITIKEIFDVYKKSMKEAIL